MHDREKSAETGSERAHFIVPEKLHQPYFDPLLIRTRQDMADVLSGLVRQ